jgi:hypothetical protein
MDSTAQTAPRDYDIINEIAATGAAWIRQPIQPLGTEISSTKLHPRVTHGFDSPNSPYGLRNDQRTAVMHDGWIRQPQQTLGTTISSTKLHPRVTLGFDSPKRP